MLGKAIDPKLLKRHPEQQSSVKRARRLAGPLWEVPLKDWAARLAQQKRSDKVQGTTLEEVPDGKR